MNAGLPITGITGSFYILSAIIAFLLEVVRTLRGKSSVKNWQVVIQFFGISVAMVLTLTVATIFFTKLTLLNFSSHYNLLALAGNIF